MAFKEHISPHIATRSTFSSHTSIQSKSSAPLASSSASAAGNWRKDADEGRRIRSHSSFTIVNPTPTITHLNRGASRGTSRPPRAVPPFSIQAQQKNTVVWRGPLTDPGSFKAAQETAKTPQASRITARREKSHQISAFPKQRSTSFRMYFDRGDLPFRMEYLYGGERIAWTIDVDKLDYGFFLPLCFDGLAETDHPYKTYARQAVSDLLSAGGNKIAPIIPQLILPLKQALNTKNLDVMCATLKIIQQLVQSSDTVGPALVPFFRQLLPMFNAYRVKNINCGDDIDYSQKNNMNLGDLIDDTLQLLEIHGGEDAFINIKYMVPTYESCFLN